MTNQNKSNLEILIVDDDVIMTLLHKNHLLRSNITHSTITFFNGKQTLNYIQKEKEKSKSFLVLLDLNMPVMNGWDFLKTCEEMDLNKVFVVVVTSSTYQSDISQASKYEKVIDVKTKPLTSMDVESIKSLKEIKCFFTNEGK